MKRVVAPLEDHLAPLVERDQLVGFRAQHLFHHRRRNREACGCGANHQGLRHRERERQVDREARTPTRCTGDLHAPPDGAHFVAHHVHADAASGNLGHRFGAGKARKEHELHPLLLGERLVLGEQPLGYGPGAQPHPVDALPVVRELQHDFIRFLAKCDGDAPGLGLALRSARAGILDTVHEGVAQHVLQRRGDSLEHATVELDLPALDAELRLLAEIARRLAHHAMQPLRQAGKRHRAQAHQVLLQLATDARLLQQRRVRLAKAREQRLLDRCGIAQSLGHHARELLQPGVAIEFQRVELALALMEHCAARLHLAVGLDLDLAQLRAQAGDALAQVAEHRLDLAQLGFDA